MHGSRTDIDVFYEEDDDAIHINSRYDKIDFSEVRECRFKPLGDLFNIVAM